MDGAERMPRSVRVNGKRVKGNRGGRPEMSFLLTK
jgi:hypothetical protein